MTDLTEYAKRAAVQANPRPGFHMTNSPMPRESFAAGILHLAARLAEDDVIEAGSLFEVDGRCWENYGGGEEYCSHHPFTSRAEAEKHRDDHHTKSADVWRDDSHMERLAAMLAKIAEGDLDADPDRVSLFHRDGTPKTNDEVLNDIAAKRSEKR